MLSNGYVRLAITATISNAGETTQRVSGSENRLGLLYVVYDDTFNFPLHAREHRAGDWMDVPSSAAFSITETILLREQAWRQVNSPIRLVALARDPDTNMTDYFQAVLDGTASPAVSSGSVVEDIDEP